MRNAGELQLTSTAPGSGLVELHWGSFSGEWLRGLVDIALLARHYSIDWDIVV